MMIIDGTNMIMGRLATFAAKKAMLGEEVIIVNSSKVVISGKKNLILKRYKERRDRGTHSTGPHFPRLPERILKRAIRGMLPYKQPKGKDALKRVKCFRNLPKEFEGKKLVQVEGASSDKLPSLNKVTLYDISKFLGAKL